mmetsp:Transcript_10482/g.31322  ORF Transcript_10482/g.31322 Transcript_10482/m.31322 type:complete len:435 (+) Transcript_10482:1339-2643(+)
MRVLRQLLQVSLGREAHLLGLGAQDREAARRVGRGQRQLAVEPAKPAQRRVDGAGPRRGCEDDDALVGLHPVEQGEQLRHDPLLELALRLVALWCERVQLVDEDDGGRVGLGLLKHLAQRRLGLAGSLGHDLGAVDGAEPHASLLPDCLRDHRFAGAGGTVDNDAARRPHAQMVKHLWLLERQVDQLAELRELLVEPADVGVSDRRVLARLLFADLVLGKDLRLRADDAGCGERRVTLGNLHPHHFPAQRMAVDLRLDDVSLGDGPAHVLEVGREAAEPLLEPALEPRRRLADQAQLHSLRLGQVPHRRRDDRVAGGEAQVGASGGGELDVVLRQPLLRAHRHANRLALLAAAQQHRLAAREAERLERVGAEHQRRRVGRLGLGHGQPLSALHLVRRLGLLGLLAAAAKPLRHSEQLRQPLWPRDQPQLLRPRR